MCYTHNQYIFQLADKKIDDETLIELVGQGHSFEEVKIDFNTPDTLFTVLEVSMKYVWGMVKSVGT